MSRKRIVVSFSEQCRLRCPFCYSPFNGLSPDFATVERILLRVKEYGIDTITFGGGDPFQYKFLPQCLRAAKAMSFLVHVDTNCLGITHAHTDLICDTVDLLGVPLDGTEGTHDTLRMAPGHFQAVTRWLDHFLSMGVRMKVNTVLTRQNAFDLGSLADWLRRRDLTVWSIYEFMPLHQAVSERARYEIPDTAFRAAVVAASIPSAKYRVEVTTQNERRSDYLFVRTDGEVFTHDPVDDHQYLELGSIFDDDWLAAYFQIHKNMISKASAGRYRLIEKQRRPTTPSTLKE